MCSMDPNSYANAHEIKIIHSHMKLNVNFDQKVIRGTVIHTAEVVGEQADEIVFDTNHVNVHSVAIEGGQELKYAFGDIHPSFGQPLIVKLPQTVKKGASVKIVMDYSTTETCSAAQWLEPSQTVGKKHPYLFTQCQPIHARSLVPIQDSPSVKFKYSAEISVPSHLRALMSAVPIKEETEGDLKTCFFTQDIAIPSYLLAIAVGNLVGSRVGPRSTVWSEPEVIDKAAWEFVDTEKFISTGEELLTPYVWGVYDLLILPASFPYGGMENPCIASITFVTPSLLAGDRSLVDVVAHEIAHSWMGNLVTSASWEHFWLNEGFTVCIERKIMGRLHGEPERHFSAIIGNQALNETIKQFESIGKPEYTKLCPCLHGIDPDEVTSSIPYEKGFHLLFYLETILGGAAVFDHVETFSHKSITSEDFKSNLYVFFHDKKEILDSVDWDAWFNGVGKPPVENVFDTTLANACQSLADRWDKARDSPQSAGFTNADISGFESNQVLVFLEAVQNKPAMPVSALDYMDSVYELGKSGNCEIRCRWYLVNLKADREAVFAGTVDLITSMGRMKYVRPLYRALAKAKNGLMLARETFTKHKSFYHPICAALVQKDIF
ncbi:Leukotriene A-4 hydrolase [Dinochytrium kinnereticum]|nr:Leukotriene A-4 hydrolase [Dinochytrium kinnereticum]